MVRILNNYTKMLKRGIKMELVKHTPTDEELYYQQQQELMLQLQSVSTSMEQEKYRYHPNYYTHDVQAFLIEREQPIGSTTRH